MDSIPTIVIAAFVIFGIYVVYQMVRPRTPEEIKEAEQRKKRKAEELRQEIEKYGNEIVTAAKKRKFKVGMGKELVLKYIGKPKDIRNRIETAEGLSEEWYYGLIKDYEGQPMLDNEGEKKYETFIVITNELITEVHRP